MTTMADRELNQDPTAQPSREVRDGRQRAPQATMVIVNPYSGRGRGGRLKEKLEAALSARQIPHALKETSKPGEAIDLAQEATAAGYENIIGVGGDGTISEIVNGLAQAAPTEQPVGKLAIVSMGSGNDFASSLKLSQDPLQAVEAVAQGRVRPCDLGYVTIQAGGRKIDRYFANNFGTGLDAQVTLESIHLKWLQGAMLYGVAALRALLKLKTPAVDLSWEDANGQTHTRNAPISLVSVGNTYRSGGGFQLTPGAQIDDGLLDLGVADALSRWQLLQLLPKALQGNHVHHPAFTLVQFRQMQLKTSEPLPVEMDGEVITEQAEEITMTVQPGRLQLLI
ncbi:MAG: diacylglycerol kinase family lipid kinase [Caldilineaceae bacterium]|nr:diacylglycerol kinase family lipid kinase [Caldilineaceae bacterium]